VKDVYYPKYSPTRPLYEKCRNANGGYGGLFSVTFHSTAEAIAFFDALDVKKGPSLGTNFTLRSVTFSQAKPSARANIAISCPYTLLAHYGELKWVSYNLFFKNIVREQAVSDFF
jgi:cystathionine gamma-synthase